MLSGANVTAGRVALYHQGDLLFYQYPQGFLDDNKNLVYSTNRHQVYR